MTIRQPKVTVNIVNANVAVENTASFTLPAFSPDNLQGLVMWLDADDTNTISESGGFVSQWSDKSINAFDVAQTNQTNKPQTGINTIGDKNVITFDGADNYVENLGIDLVIGPQLSVFMVANRKTIDIFPRGKLSLWETGQLNDQDNIPSIAFDDRNNPQEVLGFDRNNISNRTLSPDNGVPFIYTTIFDGTNNNSFLNGSSAGFINPTAISGAFNIQNIRVGTRQFGGSPFLFWHGDIGEIIIYDRALGNEEITLIEIYLSGKWDIARG